MHKPSLWSCEVPQKNLGPIGLAVLTFIGYKQTNRQTDRQAKFIYRSIKDLIVCGFSYSCWWISFFVRKTVFNSFNVELFRIA